MSERKPGWYWVKTDFNTQWEAAEFDGRDWHVTRADHEWTETMLDEIGLRIPYPEEPWYMVPVIATPEMVAVYTNEGDIYGTPQELHEALLLASPVPGGGDD